MPKVSAFQAFRLNRYRLYLNCLLSFTCTISPAARVKVNEVEEEGDEKDTLDILPNVVLSLSLIA